MAAPRPAGKLVGWWLRWLDGHCDIKGHLHLRYQCSKSFWLACRGASNAESPRNPPSREAMCPEGAAWHEWVFLPCTVLGHNIHHRNLCRESREQALRGCVVLDRPQDE